MAEFSSAEQSLIAWYVDALKVRRDIVLDGLRRRESPEVQSQRMIDADPEWGDEEWRTFAGYINAMQNRDAFDALPQQGQRIVLEVCRRAGIRPTWEKP